jgi:hypothetical protein
VAGYFRALQRNAVGTRGRLLFWLDPAWSPAVHPLFLLVLAALAATVWVAVTVVSTGPDGPIRLTPGQHGGVLTEPASVSPPADR